MKCENCKHLHTMYDRRDESFKWCAYINDNPHEDIERDCEHYAPMTNADRIRSMTDEELAEVLFGSCLECMGVEECSYHVGSLKDIPDCKSCILDWLRAESESI